MIFPDIKLMFIHVPKTGGSTVRKLLTDYLPFKNINNKLGMHYSIWEAIKKYPDLDIANYRVLTIKRNTWARLASEFVQQYYGSLNIEHKATLPDDPIRYYRGRGLLNAWLGAVTVDGEVSPNLHIMEFETLDDDIKKFFETELGITLPEKIRRIRVKEKHQAKRRDEIIKDPEFQELIADRSAKEIAYLGYDIPEVNGNNRVGL